MMPENIEKNIYINTGPNQNHTTMIPKKCRYFWFLSENYYSMIPENIKNIMYLTMIEEKPHYQDVQKIQIF